MRVGPLDIAPDVLLAPMAAVTDLPFRTICEEFGLGLTITEFLSASAICQGADKTISKMTPSLNGRRFGVQIFGREPAALAQAAGLARQIGASLVDINMGCPAKRVVAGACGSALMKEPELAQVLVRAVREALPSEIPVTVKHRAGWDDRNLNAPEFACAMVEAGAAMITVHGRTRTQGFSGKSSREIIARVRKAVPPHIPVVGNGDVVSAADYLAMRAETGCDAVMIGRGALGNPWLFRSIAALLAGQPDPGPPSVSERRAVFLRHVGLMRENTPEKRAQHELRKAVAWYSKGLPRSAELRDRLSSVHDPALLVEGAEQYFSTLQDRVTPITTQGEGQAAELRAAREKFLALARGIDKGPRPVA
jgi:tRNA-dihydrouridine synthase B